MKKVVFQGQARDEIRSFPVNARRLAGEQIMRLQTDLNPVDSKPMRTIGLVLLQPHNWGFSVPVMFRSKAQCAGNGLTLGKRCNAAAGHHRNALWVALSAPMDCVAPLGKGKAIPGEARLAMSADKTTELPIMRLKEY